jgi:hypothetical protein
MSALNTISLDESPRSESAVLTHELLCRTELSEIPKDWEVSFPLDENSRCTVFGGKFGTVVHQFSKSETRFVVKGELKSGDDLMACLKAAELHARQFKSSQLVTQEKVRPDWLNASDCFQQCGFEPLDESLIFECPFRPFVERLNRIMEVLVRNSAVPGDARVTDLTEGRELAGVILERAKLMDRFDFDQRLRVDVTKPISADYSQLVWVGDTLAGIILVAPAEGNGTYEIPIRYIIPAYRQTWVNALLIHSCVKRGEMMGATTIRFNANSKTHHETIRLAKQAGCVLVATSHRYGKSLR